MSAALAVYHGLFGRARLLRLDRAMVTHAHREGQITLHVGGDPAAMRISGLCQYVGPDRALAVNPWEPHNFAPTDRQNGHLLLILNVDPAWFVGKGEHAAMRFGCPSVDVTPAIRGRIRRIIEFMRQGMITDRFDEYVFELVSDCIDNAQAPRETACCEPMQPNDTRICRAIELICQTLERDMNLDEVARNSGLSRQHFFALFRKQTGLTPNQFRNTLKTERAIEWLTRSDGQVVRIGLDLGFSSQSSFARFFAANVGIAPTNYRRAAHLMDPARPMTEVDAIENVSGASARGGETTAPRTPMLPRTEA